MKAIEILKGVLKDIDIGRIKFEDSRKQHIFDIKEALIELQDIESYIEGQIKDCVQSGLDYGQKVAYSGILARLRG